MSDTTFPDIIEVPVGGMHHLDAVLLEGVHDTNDTLQSNEQTKHPVVLERWPFSIAEVNGVLVAIDM